MKIFDDRIHLKVTLQQAPRKRLKNFLIILSIANGQFTDLVQSDYFSKLSFLSKIDWVANSFWNHFHRLKIPQLAFIHSNFTMETSEQGKKPGQS